jgi:hypothetical protein
MGASEVRWGGGWRGRGVQIGVRVRLWQDTISIPAVNVPNAVNVNDKHREARHAETSSKPEVAAAK